MNHSTRVVVCVAALILVSTVAGAVLIEKQPDQGPFWHPLSATGTYVYADCFVAPDAGDLTPTTLGTWLLQEQGGVNRPEGLTTESVPGGVGPGPTVRFEIWGDLGGGGGPDPNNVLATTGSFDPNVPTQLTFVSMPVASATPLSPGGLYWFAATTVGETGTGSYQTGGHTQNSAYTDDCTFWYSNDPAGVNFDGQNLTPEMAFSVDLAGGVPTLPGLVLALLAVALTGFGLFAMRRRHRPI